MIKITKVILNNKSRTGEYWYARINKRSYYYKATIPKRLITIWLNQIHDLKNVDAKTKRKIYNEIVRKQIKPKSKPKQKKKSKPKPKPKPKPKKVKKYKSKSKDAIKKSKGIKQQQKSKQKSKDKKQQSMELNRGVFSKTFSYIELMNKTDTITQEILASAGVELKSKKQLDTNIKKYKNRTEYDITFQDESGTDLAECFIHGLTPTEFKLRFGTHMMSITNKPKTAKGYYLKELLNIFNQYGLKTFEHSGNVKNIKITMRLRI